MAKKQRVATDFETEVFPTWCPGCGDWSIWGAIKQALAELGIAPHELIVVYGIGCSGNMCSFLNAYGFHALHGRALPTAIGAKLANHDLPVLVVNGDGDNYGEGLSHWIHAMRGNHSITHIVHDNLIYGLTTGQTSPTSEQGFKTKSTPDGVIERQVNPLGLALEAGASFIARGFAGEHEHLKELIRSAMLHRGYSLVDVFQPCVTFNHVQTYDYYRDRLYRLETIEGYDSTSHAAAHEQAHKWGDQLPIGVIFTEERPVYTEEIEHLKQPLALKKRAPKLAPLLKELQ
jgi:2-oxoglutarate ferredoxin oxidoreductase subunit beta